MARPREFDEEVVLEAALLRFWNNGYEATSMRDLTEHTGMTTASLYNAFGDKRAIYQRVLSRYVNVTLKSCSEIFLSDIPPMLAMRRFFDATVEEALADGSHKGCFVVNTALEVAPHDEDFRNVVNTVFNKIENYICNCVLAGQQDGTFLTLLPASDVARFALSSILGLRVLARTRPERELLAGVVRPFFALLETKSE